MQKGFTLIEILIYVSLIGLVSVGFINFALSTNLSRSKVFVVQETQANARVALDLISQKIRVSNGLNVASSTFDSDPGVLSLSMADNFKNPTVIDLDQNDGVLQITEGTSTPETVTSDEVRVTNLVFTNLTSSSTREAIRVEFSVAYATTTDIIYTYSIDVQTAVSIRQ